MAEKFSILYVDDEPQNLISFKATFRRDYIIYTATSGLEGIGVMRNHPVNLIITDQRMPEMTGVELLKQIYKKHPDTVRIMLTGFAAMIPSSGIQIYSAYAPNPNPLKPNI